MKSSLRATLEQAVQDWVDEESRGFDWPLLSICDAELAVHITDAAEVVVDSVIQTQKVVGESVDD